MNLTEDKTRFIEHALKVKALKFGSFTLKSGRLSPYFFNLGAFSDGESLSLLGELYAKCIVNSHLEFDQLFGPAYKGLPLATAAAMHLFTSYNKNTPVSFNRKEKKDHGEGGVIIGAPLCGKTLILDDVITAGTAFNEAKNLIEEHNATVSGLVIALDRQERLENKHFSALESIKQSLQIPVLSLITLSDLIHFAKVNLSKEQLNSLRAYQADYGVTLDL